MRCARVDSLLDRYVDGTLDTAAAGAVSRHLRSCARCTEKLAGARRLAAGLVSAGAMAAPQGFARRVMDEVYRQALRGPGEPAAERESEPEAREARREGFYRRLGFTFMLSAGILAASLLIPRASYPTFIRDQLAGTGLAPGGPSVVKNALIGAGRVVQGTLREGGSPAEHQGGGAK